MRRLFGTTPRDQPRDREECHGFPGRCEESRGQARSQGGRSDLWRHVGQHGRTATREVLPGPRHAGLPRSHRPGLPGGRTTAAHQCSSGGRRASATQLHAGDGATTGAASAGSSRASTAAWLRGASAIHASAGRTADLRTAPATTSVMGVDRGRQPVGLRSPRAVLRRGSRRGSRGAQRDVLADPLTGGPLSRRFGQFSRGGLQRRSRRTRWWTRGHAGLRRACRARPRRPPTARGRQPSRRRWRRRSRAARAGEPSSRG